MSKVVIFLRLEFAPMEGLTDDVYRRLHRKYFSGVDRYYTPFLSPSDKKIFSPKELREVLPEHNENVPLVPQLLTSDPALFCAGANLLRDLGYVEVNLNLGCPSGTVTAKGRGAGLLFENRREELKQLLDGIFAACPLEVSVKTRLGRAAPEEFEAILALFSQYPIKTLIVHPRVREDLYRRPVRMEWFEYARTHYAGEICLSGGIGNLSEFRNMLQTQGNLDAVMLGRGLAADPGLAEKILGRPGPGKEIYRAFVEELFEETARRLGSERNTMFRMKEIWSYMICLFGDHERLWKQLKKAVSVTDYRAAVAKIFLDLPFLDEIEKSWV